MRPSSPCHPLLLAAGVAALAAVPARAQSTAAGDAGAGGMAFIQCADCHGTTASHGVGPGLRGVVGRAAGKADGFAYSAAMVKSALVWDAKSLDAFLANPKAAVPGTSMDFPGVGDAKERADLIAYLGSLK
jgi:cytochrome c